MVAGAGGRRSRCMTADAVICDWVACGRGGGAAAHGIGGEGRGEGEGEWREGRRKGGGLAAATAAADR